MDQKTNIETDVEQMQIITTTQQPFRIPFYGPKNRCPKCAGKDVGTLYVKTGGRYGDPCEFYPKEVREHEHLHRCCRRCGYKWCEACVLAG